VLAQLLVEAVDRRPRRDRIIRPQADRAGQRRVVGDEVERARPRRLGVQPGDQTDSQQNMDRVPGAARSSAETSSRRRCAPLSGHCVDRRPIDNGGRHE
jgi:hypothetical protein